MSDQAFNSKIYFFESWIQTVSKLSNMNIKRVVLDLDKVMWPQMGWNRMWSCAMFATKEVPLSYLWPDWKHCKFFSVTVVLNLQSESNWANPDYTTIVEKWNRQKNIFSKNET